MDDDERIAKFVEKQIERAGGVDENESGATELKRDNEEEKVGFSLFAAKKEDKKASTSKLVCI